MRWLVRLDPADEAAYRAAVGPLVPRIERGLGPAVLANRARAAPDGWRLAPWGPSRAAWRRTLRRAVREARRGTVFAVVDVRDCYGSISTGTIVAVLGPEAAHAVALLRRFAVDGVRGLPVGPEASAVLANGILAALDRSLRAGGVRHLRWVDDVVLWGADRDVRRALGELHRAAEGLGLELHDRKTRLLDDREEARVTLGGADSSMIAAP